MLTYKDLSPEQQLFVQRALDGENILVDACIGSGKTTTIQVLCNELPATKRILYMTYNKLLKLDAKAKIKRRNVMVTGSATQSWPNWACIPTSPISSRSTTSASRTPAPLTSLFWTSIRTLRRRSPSCSGT